MINNNNLTIEVDSKKSQKKIPNSSNNKNKSKLNNENINKTIQPKQYISSNLPLITKEKEILNNEINDNQNNFLTENNNASNISATIIDEREKSFIEPVKKRLTYKIIFIYKNQDYYITIKPNCKISDIKEIIAKEIYLDKDKVILIYKDKEIDDYNKNVPVNKFIDFSKLKSRPIIYVKKKYINNMNSLNISDSYKYNPLHLENKIKIINYPTMSNSNLTADEDLFNIVSEFCKNNSIISPFQIERNDDNPDLVYHTISFASSDIVFDFNRYFTLLKITNPLFKDTKSVLMIANKRRHLSKNNSNNNSNSSMEIKRNKKKSYLEIYEQRKNNGQKKRNLLNMNVNAYINNTGPYITPFEQYQMNEKENKKKWLDPKGFISSVNKYSGVKI